MYTLIQHIEYLMMRYDCVVVPGWGALVAQYSEPHYDAASATMVKPQRSISFNASVNHNDGLLAQSIARREAVSFSRAERMIADVVTVYKKQVAQGFEVPMGRLGYFRSSNGVAEFVPFAQNKSRDGYFGLRDISIRPLNHTQAEPVFDASSRSIFSHKTWKVAASIAVLVAMTLFLTTPISVDRRHNYASISLPEVKAPAKHSPIDWTDFEADLAIALPAHEQLQTSDNNAESDRNLLLDEGGNNLLIIASLSSQAQAQGYISQHPDMAAHMAVSRHSDRVFHVYIARSSNYNHLLALRSRLPSAYSQSWILVN